MHWKSAMDGCAKWVVVGLEECMIEIPEVIYGNNRRFCTVFEA